MKVAIGTKSWAAENLEAPVHFISHSDTNVYFAACLPNTGVYLARVSRLRFGPLLMVVCYYNIWKIFLNHASLCRFYIGCDKCQDWFHGTCVGITATEADNIEFYTCPKCTQSQTQASKQPLTSKDYDTLKRLLRSLQVGWSLFLTLKRDISV